MRQFLKENLMLMLGILLPLLLILAFYLAALLPKLLIQPPRYDLLYMTSPYPHDGLNIKILQGKIQLWISPQLRKGALPMPHLFLFEAKTQSSREIPLSIPKESSNSVRPNAPELLAVPELQALNFDTQNTSPDGYTAENPTPNYGTLASILVFAHAQRNFLITKRGHTVNISDKNPSIKNQKSIKFIGWVLPQ